MQRKNDVKEFWKAMQLNVNTHRWSVIDHRMHTRAYIRGIELRIEKVKSSRFWRKIFIVNVQGNSTDVDGFYRDVCELVSE